MEEFLAELQQYIHQQLTLIFYRKVDGIVQQMADATYSLYLDRTTSDNGTTTLFFTNGMDNEGKSSISVVLPASTQASKITEEEWHMEYAVGEQSIVVKLLLPKVTRAVPSQIEVGKPNVKEVRDPAGNLLRLYLETPEEGASIAYLDNLKKIITQLFTAWQDFTVTTSGETAEDLSGTMTFSALEWVSLPGNIFFEVRATSPQGDKTLEIATTVMVDLENSRITYELDGQNFQIAKAT